MKGTAKGMNHLQKQILVPSIITSVLLLIAIFPIKQYGFFILLRWVVFITAVYVGFFMYQAKKATWIWLMGIIAVLFNPIKPIHLSKGFWQPVDFVTAIIFLISLITDSKKKKNIKKRL